MFNNTFSIPFFLFLFSGIVFAENNLIGDALKINKDGIKVYTYQTQSSDIATFKAVTHMNTSLDSILAVMMDNEVCEEWVHACNESILIKSVNFNERYHYQILDLPFPFQNRDFIFHSIMMQDPLTGIVTITISARPDYCHKNELDLCLSYKATDMVRITKSLGQYTLEPGEQGTKFTWIQHTDPGGNLPSWLVNQFLIETPFFTLKNLSQKVRENKYKHSRLVYNDRGIAIALYTPQQTPFLITKDYSIYQHNDNSKTPMTLVRDM